MAIDRNTTIRFTFNGRSFEAFSGQSVAAALYSAGVRTFSRSFKYHRPRGLLCVAGRCPNCLMNVDGTPNVRVCTLAAREGMAVKAQNAWPSLDADVLSMVGMMDRFLQIGFYYKTFIHPRAMWPVYEKVLKRIAGQGELKMDADAVHHRVARRYMHADVAVIGGGPAGMAAALEAARADAQVVLVDEQPTLGGHLASESRLYQSPPEFDGRPGSEIAEALATQVGDQMGLKVLTGSTAIGAYEGGLIGVSDGERLIELRAKRMIVASGAFERPQVFFNSDLPGVMLGTGVLRLLNLEGVKAGERALVVSAHDEGLATAGELLRSGITVVGVVETRTKLPIDLPVLEELQQAGVPILPGYTISGALGRGRVTGGVAGRLDSAGHVLAGTSIAFDCDLIVVSTAKDTSRALLHQSGATMEYDEDLGVFIPAELPDGVYAAGEVTGSLGLPMTLLQGKIAGLDAAISLGLNRDGATGSLAGYREDLARHRAPPAPSSSVAPAPGASRGRNKNFVCLCEDVTEKDLCDGIAEGFDGIEVLKRYSTATMGPCQGKMCSLATTAITAREIGLSVSEVGVTTSRPLYQPVDLGVLAGSHLEPVKVTSIHNWHTSHGATIMNAGDWKRPRAYISEADEVLAVREKVGLIDVGTLGKFEVKGKDAAQLLELVYTNNVANLRINRIRYGLMCDESGVIMDDGTVTRLADDRYFVTTTSSGAEGIEQWLNWWAAGTDMCVHIINVTAGLAAINLAGPRARQTLSKLTSSDISNERFPYLRSERFEVAGVPSLVLRIGFVGELGYEMHFAAEYGEHVWSALMDAGRDFGIVPFGVDAQRLLRLEKGHIIVTQDTDALSTPIEADMSWAVKFDKEDFIGKHSLLNARTRGPRDRLVGFEMRHPAIVPGEGTNIIQDGKPCGRVTSARYSHRLDKSIGLAWVPVGSADPGSWLQITANGNLADARVVEMPFYDPAGGRVRS